MAIKTIQQWLALSSYWAPIYADSNKQEIKPCIDIRNLQEVHWRGVGKPHALNTARGMQPLHYTIEAVH